MDGFNNQEGRQNQNNGNQNNNNNHPTNDMPGPNDLDIYLNNSNNNNNNNNSNNNTSDIWGNIEPYNFNHQPGTSYSMDRSQEHYPQQHQQMQQQMPSHMMPYPYMGYNQYGYPMQPHMMSTQHQMHQMNSGNMPQQMGQTPGQLQQMAQQQGPGQNQQMGQQPGQLQQPGQHQQMGQPPGQHPQSGQHQQPGQHQQMGQQPGQLQMGQPTGQLQQSGPHQQMGQQGPLQNSQQMGQQSGQHPQTTQERQPLPHSLQHPPYIPQMHPMTQQQVQYYRTQEIHKRQMLEQQKREAQQKQIQSRMGSQPLSHQLGTMRPTQQSSIGLQQQRNQQEIGRQGQMPRQETMPNSFNPELYTQQYNMPPVRFNQNGVPNPYQSMHPSMQPLTYGQMPQGQMSQGQRPPGQMPPRHMQYPTQFPDDLLDAPELPATWDPTTPSTSSFQPQYNIPRSEATPIRQPTLQRSLNVETNSNPGSNTQLSGGVPSQPGSRPTAIELTHHDSPLVTQQQQFQRQQQQQSHNQQQAMNQAGPSNVMGQTGPSTIGNQGGITTAMSQGSTSNMMGQTGPSTVLNQGGQSAMINHGAAESVMGQGSSSMMNHGGSAHPMNQGGPSSAMTSSGPSSMMNQNGPPSLLIQGGPPSAMSQRGPASMMGPNGPSSMLNQGTPPGILNQAGPSSLLNQGRPPSSLHMMGQAGPPSSMSQGVPPAMSQEIRMRQNGYTPMDYRPLPTTSHQQFPYQHQPPGPPMMNHAISPTTTASRRAAELTPKKTRGRGGGRQSQSARAQAKLLAQQQQQQQQMAMQQQHNPYFGLPGPGMLPRDKEEERRRYMMNTIYPKGTKEPDPGQQRQMFPSIEQLHGPMGFPGPSQNRMMPHSLDNNSPPEVLSRPSQHGGSVGQIHSVDELFNSMHSVQDNEPDGDAVYQLLANEANSTAAAAAAAAVPQSLAEALNRPPMTASNGSVPRNDTEAVEMIHQITQSHQPLPRHDHPDFEPRIIPMPSTSMEVALQGLRLVSEENSSKGARQEPSTSKQSAEPETNRDGRQSRQEMSENRAEPMVPFFEMPENSAEPMVPFFESHQAIRAAALRPEAEVQPPPLLEPPPQPTPTQETRPEPPRPPPAYESMPDFPTVPAGKPAPPRRGKPSFNVLMRAVNQASERSKPKGKGKPRKNREGIDTDMSVKDAPLSQLVLPMRAVTKKAKINYREDDDEEEERAASPDEDSSGSESGRKKKTKRTPKKPVTGRGRGRKPAKQISPSSVDTPPPAASTSYNSPKFVAEKEPRAVPAREVEPRRSALLVELELDDIPQAVENEVFLETDRSPRRERKSKKTIIESDSSSSEDEQESEKHTSLLAIVPKKFSPLMESEYIKPTIEQETVAEMERPVTPATDPGFDDSYLFDDIGPSTSTADFVMDPIKCPLSIKIETRSYAPVKKAPDSLDDFHVDTPCGKRSGTSPLTSPVEGDEPSYVPPVPEEPPEEIISTDGSDKFIPHTPGAHAVISPNETSEIETYQPEIPPEIDEEYREEERRFIAVMRKEQDRREKEMSLKKKTNKEDEDRLEEAEREEMEKQKEQERKAEQKMLEEARKVEQERIEKEERLEVAKKKEEGRLKQEKRLAEVRQREQERMEERRLEEVRRREQEQKDEERRIEELRKEEQRQKEKAERKEQKRREKERRQKEQEEREEAERREQLRLKAERKAKEDAERERAQKEQERVERERIQKEKAEKERVQKERAEREERERIERENKEKARLEKEKQKELAEEEKRERSRSHKEKRKLEAAQTKPPTSLEKPRDKSAKGETKEGKNQSLKEKPSTKPEVKTIQGQAIKVQPVNILALNSNFISAIDESIQHTQSKKVAKKRKDDKKKRKEELEKQRLEMEAVAKKVKEKRERERLMQEEENRRKQEEAAKAARVEKNKKNRKQEEKAKNKHNADHRAVAASAVPIGSGKGFKTEPEKISPRPRETSSSQDRNAVHPQRASFLSKRDGLQQSRHLQPEVSKLTQPLRKEDISPSRHKDESSKNIGFQRKSDVSPGFGKTADAQVRHNEPFRRAEAGSFPHNKQQIPSINVEHVRSQFPGKPDVAATSKQFPPKVADPARQEAHRKESDSRIPGFNKTSAISPAFGKTSDVPTFQVKKVEEPRRSQNEVERDRKPSQHQELRVITDRLKTSSISPAVSQDKSWPFHSNHEPSPASSASSNQSKETTPNASRNLFGTPTSVTPRKHSPYEIKSFNQNQQRSGHPTPHQGPQGRDITPKQRQEQGEQPNQPLLQPIFFPGERPPPVAELPPDYLTRPPPPIPAGFKPIQTTPKTAGRSRWDQSGIVSTRAGPSRAPIPPPSIKEPCILDAIWTDMDRSEKAVEKKPSHTEKPEKQEKPKPRRESISLEKQSTPTQQSLWNTSQESKNITPPVLLQAPYIVNLTDPYIPKNTTPPNLLTTLRIVNLPPPEKPKKYESSEEMARRAAQWALENTKRKEEEERKAKMEEEAKKAREEEERLAALTKKAEDEEARAAAMAISSPERPMEEEEITRPVFTVPFKRAAPSLISPPFEPLDTFDFESDLKKTQEKTAAEREDGEIFTEDEEEEEGEIVEMAETSATLIVEKLAVTKVLTQTAVVEEPEKPRACALLPTRPSPVEQMRSIIDSVIEPLTPEEAEVQPMDSFDSVLDKDALQPEISETSQPSTSQDTAKYDPLQLACEAIWDGMDDMLDDDELFSEEPSATLEDEEVSLEPPQEPVVQMYQIDDFIPEVGHFEEVETCEEVFPIEDIFPSETALVESGITPGELTLEEELAAKDIEDLVHEMIESVVALEAQQVVSQPEVAVNETPLLKEILEELLSQVDEVVAALNEAEQTTPHYLGDVEDLFAQQLQQNVTDLQRPFWEPNDELDSSFPVPWSPHRPQNEDNNVEGTSLFCAYEENQANRSPQFMASTSFDAFSPSFYGNYGAAFDFGRSPEFGPGTSGIDQRFQRADTSHDDVFGDWETAWDDDVRNLEQDYGSKPNFESQSNVAEPSTEWGNSFDMSINIQDTDANLEPEFGDLEALFNAEAASTWNEIQKPQTSAVMASVEELDVCPVEEEPTSERTSLFEEHPSSPSFKDDQLYVHEDTFKEVITEDTAPEEIVDPSSSQLFVPIDTVIESIEVAEKEHDVAANMEEVEEVVKFLVETVEEDQQLFKEAEPLVTPPVVAGILEKEITEKEADTFIEEVAMAVEPHVDKDEHLIVVVQEAERIVEKEVEAVLAEVECGSLPMVEEMLVDVQPVSLEEVPTDKLILSVDEEVSIAPVVEKEVMEQEESIQESEDVVETLAAPTEIVVEFLKRTPEFTAIEFVVEKEQPPSPEPAAVVESSVPIENEIIAEPESLDTLLAEETAQIGKEVSDAVVAEEQELTTQSAVLVEEEPAAPVPPVKPAEPVEKVAFIFDEEEYEETWEEIDGKRSLKTTRWSPAPSSMKPLSQEEIEELRRMEKHPRFARRPYEVPEKRPKRTADIEIARKAAARRTGRITRSQSRSTVDEDEDEPVERVQKSVKESRRAAAEEAETKMLRKSRRRETTSDEEFVPPQPRVVAPRRSRRAQLSPQRSVSTDSEFERAPRKTRSQARQEVPISLISIPVEEEIPVTPAPVVFVTTSSVTSKWTTVECTPIEVVSADFVMPIKKVEENVSENYCLADVEFELSPLETRISQIIEFELVQICQKRKLAYAETALEYEDNRGPTEGFIEGTMIKSDRAKESYAEGNCDFEEGKPTDVRGEDIFTVTYQDSSKVSIKTKETKNRTISTRAVFKRPNIEGEANWIYPMNKAKEVIAFAGLATEARKRPLTEESEKLVVEKKRAKLGVSDETDSQMKEVLSSANITTRKRKPLEEENVSKKCRVDPATIDPFLEEELEEEDQATWSLRKSAIFLVEKATAENLENEVKNVMSCLLGQVVLADEKRLKQLVVAIPMTPIWKTLAREAPTVEKVIVTQPSSCKELVMDESRPLPIVEAVVEEAAKELSPLVIAEACKDLIAEEGAMEVDVSKKALPVNEMELSPFVSPIAPPLSSEELATALSSPCAKIILSEIAPATKEIEQIDEVNVSSEPALLQVAPAEPTIAKDLDTIEPVSIEDRTSESIATEASAKINVEETAILEPELVQPVPSEPSLVEDLSIVKPAPAEASTTPESDVPEVAVIAMEVEETAITVPKAAQPVTAEQAPIDDLAVAKSTPLQDLSNTCIPLKVDVDVPAVLENNRPVICFPISFLPESTVAVQNLLEGGRPEQFDPNILSDDDIDYLVERGLVALPRPFAIFELVEIMSSPGVIAGHSMYPGMSSSPEYALQKKLAIKADQENPFPGVLYYDTIGDVKRIMYVAGAVNRFKSLLHMKDTFFCLHDFGILAWYEFLRARGYCSAGGTVTYPTLQGEVKVIGQIFELYLKKVADGVVNMTIPLKRRLANEVHHAYAAPIEMAAYTKLIEIIENFSDLPVGVKLALLILLDEWFDDIFCDENISEPAFTREEKLALFNIDRDTQGRVTISYKQQYVFTCPLAEWVPQEWKDAAVSLYQLRLELHMTMYFVIRRSAMLDNEVRYSKSLGTFPPLSKFSLVPDVFDIFEENDEDEIEETDEIVENRQCKLLSANEEDLAALDKDLEPLWERFKEPPFSYAKKAVYMTNRTFALYRYRFPNSIPMELPWGRY